MLGNYSNNHLGLRVEKEAKDPLQPNAPPAIFRTLWNGRHAFQDSDLSGNTLSRYENDGRHTVSFWSSTDGSQALHHDALGSITATTDNSGQLKSETVYDAFGNIASQSGQSANKFGYTGHQMDQETGLIYFQARYYDPQTGRFITQDPYEGDWNTPLSLHHYLYAYGNPTVYVDLHGYESISASIDKAAEGCGAWSCAGWAFAKGAYSAATFGFAIVHDPVRDQYDEGKITGSQYVKRGIGGGTAMVGVNVASTMLGGLGGGGTTLATTMARGALTGGLISGGTDAATQGVNISAGLQESYDATRTAKTTAIGMGLGVVAPLIPAALKTEIGQAVTGAISSTVRKTREAVETAVQSVSSRMKGVVIQEAGTMGTAGAKITSKSVAATPTRHMSVGDEPYAGAHGVDDGGMAHPLKIVVRPSSSSQYTTAFEAQLSKGTDYPGKSDYVHFQESNKQLHNAMQVNDEYGQMMERLYPGIRKYVAPGSRGAFPGTTPSDLGLTWHHHPGQELAGSSREGVMQLIPDIHHTAKGSVQSTLHPDKKGGMENWGGGRKKK